MLYGLVESGYNATYIGGSNSYVRKERAVRFVEPIRDRDTLTAVKTWLRSRSLRDWALFVAGINFALRIQDLLDLKVGDVLNGTGIRETFSVQQGKTGRAVRVHVPPNARAALSEYLSEKHPAPEDHEAPLFPSRKRAADGKLNPVSRFQAYRILNSAVRQFEPDLAVGTHTLRKTWGWFAFDSGQPLEVIMHKLGHQSPAATLRYLGIRDDDVKRATETLNL